MHLALKRTLRLLLRTAATLFALTLLYVVIAWSLSLIPVPAETDGGQDITAYILSNGVHTDIVLPVRSGTIDWTEFAPYAHTTGQDSTLEWLALGWGDKGFYLETPTWNDLTASVAFKAMFALGNSAMHTTYHRQLREGPQCKRIGLSNEQYERLATYIANSFALDANGRTQLIITDANYGSTDAFYEGVGRYSLFHTCNSWTNDALKVAGQKACYWTATDRGILRQYE